MFTFKACKHNTNMKLQLQLDKTCMYLYKYHIYQKNLNVQKMENMNSMPLFMPKKPK